MCENPEPVDEQPAPEIRGGNRREDYVPETFAFTDELPDDDKGCGCGPECPDNAGWTEE